MNPNNKVEGPSDKMPKLLSADSIPNIMDSYNIPQSEIMLRGSDTQCIQQICQGIFYHFQDSKWSEKRWISVIERETDSEMKNFRHKAEKMRKRGDESMVVCAKCIENCNYMYLAYLDPISAKQFIKIIFDDEYNMCVLYEDFFRWGVMCYISGYIIKEQFVETSKGTTPFIGALNLYNGMNGGR